MKAVVYTRYGPPDVLRLAEVATPAPKDNEVLVKVHAVSVNASDWEMLRGEPLYARIWGWWRPRHPILGLDIAGRVEAACPQRNALPARRETCSQTSSALWAGSRSTCARRRALWRACLPGMTYEQAAGPAPGGSHRAAGHRTARDRCSPGRRC